MSTVCVRLAAPISGLSRYLRWRAHQYGLANATAVTAVDNDDELSHLARACPPCYTLTAGDAQVEITTGAQHFVLAYNESGRALADWLAEDHVWGPDWLLHVRSERQ
jgi:hypothetical protein